MPSFFTTDAAAITLFKCCVSPQTSLLILPRCWDMGLLGALLGALLGLKELTNQKVVR